MLYDPNWESTTVPTADALTQQVLLQAAQLIEKHGWIQGRSESPQGFCIMGALYHVTGGVTGRANQFRKARNKFSRVHNAPAPARWNDRSCRTKKQVIAALIEAANAKE